MSVTWRHLLSTVVVLLLSLSSGQAQTYTSTDTPLGIPIGSPGVTLGSTTSMITVGDYLMIGDLDVNLDYNHSYQGDLQAILTSPNGTMVELFASNLAHDLTAIDGGYLFDDEAAIEFPEPIPAYPFGDPIATGSYKPQNALAAFDGEDTAGIWTLVINDTAGGDSGMLNFWQLIVMEARDGSGSGTFASMPIAELQANSQFLSLLARRLRSDEGPRYLRPNRNLVPVDTGVGSRRSFIRLGATETTADSVGSIFEQSGLVVRAQGPSMQRNLWIAGYGVNGHVDGGFDYDFAGTAFGIQQIMGPQTLVGIAGNIYVAGGDGAGTDSRVKAAGLALYANTRFAERAYATGILGYHFGSYTTDRQTATGTALGDRDSNALLLYTEVGQNLYLLGWTMRPHLALQYQHINLDGFRETGAAPSNLSIEAEQLDSARGIAGVDLARSFERRNGNTLTPRMRVAYIQEFIDGDRVINGSFATGGAVFPITGASLGNEFGEVGAGLNYATLNGIDLFADYDLQFTTQHNQHTGRGGIAINW
ncbi:MAG: autotransporter domain-containing protein [Planctomycetaceae bacterium]|nr:autotransporter domain-containing protein [Planctomycetaceae bacterium]